MPSLLNLWSAMGWSVTQGLSVLVVVHQSVRFLHACSVRTLFTTTMALEEATLASTAHQPSINIPSASPYWIYHPAFSLFYDYIYANILFSYSIFQLLSFFSSDICLQISNRSSWYHAIPWLLWLVRCIKFQGTEWLKSHRS